MLRRLRPRQSEGDTPDQRGAHHGKGGGTYSSVGSERLSRRQEVGGSSPSMSPNVWVLLRQIGGLIDKRLTDPKTRESGLI